MIRTNLLGPWRLRGEISVVRKDRRGWSVTPTRGATKAFDIRLYPHNGGIRSETRCSSGYSGGNWGPNVLRAVASALRDLAVISGWADVSVCEPGRRVHRVRRLERATELLVRAGRGAFPRRLIDRRWELHDGVTYEWADLETGRAGACVLAGGGPWLEWASPGPEGRRPLILAPAPACEVPGCAELSAHPVMPRCALTGLARDTAAGAVGGGSS